MVSRIAEVKMSGLLTKVVLDVGDQRITAITADAAQGCCCPKSALSVSRVYFVPGATR